jgi:hypothetical protein
MRKPPTCVLLVLILSVLACNVPLPGTTEPPPTDTPAAAEPATAEVPPTEAPPTAPPTVEAPTATPTPEASPTTAPAATPTPEQVPPTTPPTATPLPPTATPLSPPTILSFTADPTTIVQGESVALTWQAVDGSEAFIEWYGSNGLLASAPGPLDPDGGTVTVKPDGSPIRLVVRNSAGDAEAQVDLTIECAHEWVPALAEHHPGRCPGEAQIGAAAQQPFENGFMIWLEPSRTIYVFYNFGRAGSPPVYEVYPDDFQEGDPESDPAIVPPAGLYQPIRGFGLVWRTHPEVREGLGWATAPEVGFQTWRQGYTGTGMHASFTLMQGIDGTIYHLEAFGSTWGVYSP